MRSPRAIKRRTVSWDTSRRSATVLTEYKRVPDVGSCMRLLIEAHARGPPSYAARTVTRPLDIRDRWTELVQKLVDAAANADPAKRNAIAKRLLGDRPVGAPPGSWPAPSARHRKRAHSQSSAAATAARNQLARLGITTLRLGEFPDARIVWQPLLPEQVLPPAPLVFSLVEEDALRHATTLLGYVLSPYTTLLFDADVRRNLMHRLNAFAEMSRSLVARRRRRPSASTSVRRPLRPRPLVLASIHQWHHLLPAVRRLPPL